MKSILKTILPLALLVLCPTPLFANGAYTHIHISQLAAEQLPEGPLRDLLLENVEVWEAGSMFPDSGYAIEDYYGEQAHWPEFHNAWIGSLRGQDLSTPEARYQASFLLGAMSHGLADQVYDTTLLARGFEVDGPETVMVDQVADYFLIVDQDVLIETTAQGPYDAISAVFADPIGYTVSPTTLADGMGRMESVVYFQNALARPMYLETWQAYPWLGTHLYNPDATGSLPHLGSLVAPMWQVAWRRMEGVASMDSDLLVGTFPVDGAVNVFVDDSESRAYSRLGMVFGYGVRREQIESLTTLRTAAGVEHPIAVISAYNVALANFMLIEPVGALEYDTEYVVELAPGVENLDGELSTVAYTFGFRTRCAPESLGDCPALPATLVTGPIPTKVPQPPKAEGTDTAEVIEAVEAVEIVSEDPRHDFAEAEDLQNDVDTLTPNSDGGCCSQVQSGTRPPSFVIVLLTLFVGFVSRLRRPR